MNRKDRRAAKHRPLTKQEKAVKMYDKLEKRHGRDVDEMILWVLHFKFGFGKIKMRNFFGYVIEEHRALVKRYEMGVAPKIHQDLIEMGVDLDEWEKEFYKNEEDV